MTVVYYCNTKNPISSVENERRALSQIEQEPHKSKGD